MNPLVLEKQEQSNWCWAACVRMSVLSFANSAPRQCEIVNQALNVRTCCSDGAAPGCNTALDENAVPALYRSVGLAAARIGLDEAALRAALSRSSLVLVLLLLEGSYHFALVYGTAGSAFSVADPKYGTFSAPYSSLLNGYQMGSLAATWAVQPAGGAGT